MARVGKKNPQRNALRVLPLMQFSGDQQSSQLVVSIRLLWTTIVTQLCFLSPAISGKFYTHRSTSTYSILLVQYKIAGKDSGEIVKSWFGRFLASSRALVIWVNLKTVESQPHETDFTFMKHEEESHQLYQTLHLLIYTEHHSHTIAWKEPQNFSKLRLVRLSQKNHCRGQYGSKSAKEMFAVAQRNSFRWMQHSALSFGVVGDSKQKSWDFLRIFCWNETKGEYIHLYNWGLGVHACKQATVTAEFRQIKSSSCTWMQIRQTSWNINESYISERRLCSSHAKKIYFRQKTKSPRGRDTQYLHWN